MTEQDKQVIEELAQLLGWRKTYWNKDALLCGTKPSVEGESEIWDLFPPSRLDGNGAFWLINECRKQEICIDFVGDREGIGVDAESFTCRLLSYEFKALTVDDLPAAVNHAALAALKAKGGKG